MSQIEAQLIHLVSFGVIGGCLVLAGLLVWLAGLLTALHGSKPTERPEIIRAYATCRPFGPGLPRPGNRSRDP